MASFAESLDAAFQEKFKIELETKWNIFSGCYVSGRKDDEDLTEEQYAFIDGFSKGYNSRI